MVVHRIVGLHSDLRMRVRLFGLGVLQGVREITFLSGRLIQAESRVDVFSYFLLLSLQDDVQL